MKYVFHVAGGAKNGGMTLTAAARNLRQATEEANAHFKPHINYGKWIGGGMLPRGPDANGNLYLHLYWFVRIK